MLPKSIRWRIQAWHSFLLVCVVTALLVAFYSYERAERLRQVDTELHAILTPLLPAIGGRPPPRGPEERRRGPREAEFEGRGNRPPSPNDHPEHDRIPESVRSGKFYYITWHRDGSVRNRSTNAPASTPLISDADFNLRRPLRSHGEFREAIHHAPDGGCTVVGTSLRESNQHLSRLRLVLILGGMGIIALGVTIGWWAAGRALRPIEEISSTAEEIATGELSKRIEVSETEGELGKLAGVLNQTFDRLETIFEQQLRFTADASHELRTPVSVILTQTQLALSRERSPEEYRKTLETCERAAERMRNLVNQLLELARIDAGEETLMLETCDLGRLARESMEFLEPLALKKNATLSQSLESVRLKADAMKLGQVIINLLNNAILHNKAGVEVCLSVQQRGETAVIRVTDNGVGIPPQAQPHLFDRFYRVDKARSRDKGSSGLGLAICKAIVESHRGTIRVESEFGKGATFIIELPILLHSTTGLPGPTVQTKRPTA